MLPFGINELPHFQGGRSVLEQLKPLQRFVIGLDRPEAETAGYILSHPKLGIHLREEYFYRDDIEKIQKAFVRWGRKTVERLNNGALRLEETPAYLLQYHTQHLQDGPVALKLRPDLIESVEKPLCFLFGPVKL
jgi:hypothetical protein